VGLLLWEFLLWVVFRAHINSWFKEDLIITFTLDGNHYAAVSLRRQN